MIWLFDIDGTLLLSGGAGREAMARALDEQLPVAGAMDGVVCAGKTDDLIIAEACRAALGHDPQRALLDRVLASYVRWLPRELERARSFRLLPGVPEVLRALRRRRGTVLTVATGNVEAGARAKLRRAGLERWFTAGGYGDGSSERTAILRRAVDAAVAVHGEGAADDHPVVVGDTVRDVQAGHALGWAVAAFADTTTPREALAEAGADVIVDDLRELLPWSRGRRGAALRRGTSGG